jgi:hypothetical protein
MFCPVCKDEFRPGFTRCAACDVDLVEDLSAVRHVVSDLPAAEEGGDFSLADLCGFITLDEARDARDSLHTQGILSEIVIRGAPGVKPGEPIEEEYWLRVEHRRFPVAARLLGCDFTVDEGASGAGDSVGEAEEDDLRYQG